MHPWWFGNMAFELALRVDVEDETASWSQMPADPGKDFLPIREAPNVINGVVYAANHVESVIDLKIDHILLEKSGVRHFLTGDRKHFTGRIQSRHLVLVLHMLQHRSGSASQFKHVSRVWFRRSYKFQKMLRCSRAISHDRVIELPEDLISRHAVQSNRCGCF